MTEFDKSTFAAIVIALSYYATFAQAHETILVPDTLPFHSTYSPEVLHQPGWDRYRMYYGSNDGTGDRIYLAENFGQNGAPPDGISNWQIFGGSNPIPVLQPGGTNEDALIHDPTVIHNADANVWLMYYTGTSDFGGNANRIFQATSPDGVNWTKQGQLALPGIDSLVFSDLRHWGYGNPSLLRMRQSATDDKLYMYFTGSPKTYSQGNGKLYVTTLDLVADPTGKSGWGAPVEIANFVCPNPDPFLNPITGQFEILFDAVAGISYNNHYADLETYKTVMKARFKNNDPLAPLDPSTIEPFWFAHPSSTFATVHGGTPSYLPKERLLFVAGNHRTSGFFFDDAAIAVVKCSKENCLPTSTKTSSPSQQPVSTASPESR